MTPFSFENTSDIDTAIAVINAQALAASLDTEGALPDAVASTRTEMVVRRGIQILRDDS